MIQVIVQDNKSAPVSHRTEKVTVRVLKSSSILVLSVSLSSHQLLGTTLRSWFHRTGRSKPPPAQFWGFILCVYVKESWGAPLLNMICGCVCEAFESVGPVNQVALPRWVGTARPTEGLCGTSGAATELQTSTILVFPLPGTHTPSAWDSLAFGRMDRRPPWVSPACRRHPTGCLSLSETIFMYCFSVEYKYRFLMPLLKAESFKDEFSQLLLRFLEPAL